MSPVSRRSFFSGVAAASLSTAAASAQVQGSNDKLRVGIIGCGGMGTAHMRALLGMKQTDNVEIVAVCDVFTKRMQKAADLTGASKQYKDYKKLLADKSIDYVLIATPEHWHYQMAMDAVDAGKNIYCEKPMTQNAEQAKKLVEKVKASKVKMQVGVQGMSDESYAMANQFVDAGAIGKVVQAQIDYSRNHDGDFWAYDIDTDARPGDNFDWEAWLGPAPKRPFDPDRAFRWRRYWDYSSGIASDLFVHRVTRIIRSCGLEFPDRGVGMGGKWKFTDSLAEIPDTFDMMLDYPGGPTVVLVSSMANDTPIEHVLRGHKATLTFTSSGFQIRPQTMYEWEVRQVTYRKTGAEDLTLHHRNLQNAIRYGAALNCPVDLGWYGVVACEMGTKAYRQSKYMVWDKGNQRIQPA